jgi:hypothetical protein
MKEIKIELIAEEMTSLIKMDRYVDIYENEDFTLKVKGAKPLQDEQDEANEWFIDNMDEMQKADILREYKEWCEK